VITRLEYTLLISLLHEVLIIFDITRVSRGGLWFLSFFFFCYTDNLYTRRDMQIISPFVLGVAPRVLPIAILILVAVRLFRLRLRFGVAFGDLVLATAFCTDDDHGGALVAGLRAGSARGRGGRCRRCSTVSVILHDARISLYRVRSTSAPEGGRRLSSRRFR